MAALELGSELAVVTPDPAEAEAELTQIANRIRGNVRRTASAIIAIGTDLIAARERLDHGRFTQWIDVEFSMSDRSAQRYIRAARVFRDKTDTVSLLAPTAIHQLAAPSTPEPVRVAILRRIEAGEKIAPGEIVSRIRKARARSKDDPDRDRQHAADRRAGELITRIGAATVQELVEALKDPRTRSAIWRCLGKAPALESGAPVEDRREGASQESTHLHYSDKIAQATLSPPSTVAAVNHMAVKVPIFDSSKELAGYIFHGTAGVDAVDAEGRPLGRFPIQALARQAVLDAHGAARR